MLYANTDDGSSALWVCDENGVVVDNISYSIADRAPILEQINEHYGTSFTGWSDNEIGLRIGDTVPNWNAYEKIEMPINGWFKTLVGGTVYTYGKVENNVLILYCKNNGSGDGSLSLPIVTEQGKIQGFTLAQSFIDIFSQRIGNITQSSIVESSLSIGDDVENWDEMTLVE